MAQPQQRYRSPSKLWPSKVRSAEVQQPCGLKWEEGRQPAPLLELRGLSKRFGSLQAVDDVSFDVRPGEIHAILGENGAGKSTLMNLLFGLTSFDVGEVRVRGERVSIKEPADAIELGVGMVHQHFKLVKAMTVVENVSLLQRSWRRPFRGRQSSRRIHGFADEFGLTVNPAARIDTLSVGEQQRVEVLKLLASGAEILILDEPTGVLTPPEWEQLRGVLLRLRANGRGIVFINHKLQEVIGLADRYTVLRRGSVVNTWSAGEANAEELANAMVGRGVEIRRRESSGLPGGKPRLDLREVELFENEREVLHRVCLTVNAGEIHGVAGVDGNGQDELVDVILGRRPVDGGTVALGDINKKQGGGHDIREFVRSGGGAVPADRHRYGVGVELSVNTNLALKKIVWGDGARYGLLRRRDIDRWVAETADRFDIRMSSVGIPLKALSGGNQQRVVLAREIDRDPTVLIAAQPTRGLDVAAVQAVYELLTQYVAGGGAVLLVSADLDELLTLADRISVMTNGRMSAPLGEHEFDRGRIGLMMASQEG